MNIDLARKVLDHIERHPEEHDQGAFSKKTLCGTTCCIAGHTLLLSGHYTLAQDGSNFVDESGRRESHDADDIAQDLLDISDSDAYGVFYDFSDEGAMSRFRELILHAEKEQSLNEA